MTTSTLWGKTEETAWRGGTPWGWSPHDKWMHKHGFAAGQWSRSLSCSFAGPPMEIWIGSIREGEGDWGNVVKVGLIGGNLFKGKHLTSHAGVGGLMGCGGRSHHSGVRKIWKQSCSDDGSENLCAQKSTSARRVLARGLCRNLRKTWGEISPRHFHLVWVKVDSVWVFLEAQLESWVSPLIFLTPMRFWFARLGINLIACAVSVRPGIIQLRYQFCWVHWDSLRELTL